MCSNLFVLFFSFDTAMKVCDGDEENSMLSLTQDGAPPEAASDPLRVDWPKVMLQHAETITTTTPTSDICEFVAKDDAS